MEIVTGKTNNLTVRMSRIEWEKIGREAQWNDDRSMRTSLNEFSDPQALIDGINSAWESSQKDGLFQNSDLTAVMRLTEKLSKRMVSYIREKRAYKYSVLGLSSKNVSDALAQAGLDDPNVVEYMNGRYWLTEEAFQAVRRFVDKHNATPSNQYDQIKMDVASWGPPGAA